MEKAKYAVFLSHATPDKPVVEELARILVRRGFQPWFDKWNLIPGEPWQQAIERALASCTACAVCLGPNGLGPWQDEEMRAAIEHRVKKTGNFRVIPVLLPRAEQSEPAPLPAFLGSTTWVEFHKTLDDEEALHRLICGIRGIEPRWAPGEAAAEGACPYLSLEAFDVGNALFFFGRESLTEKLLDKLRLDRSGTRLLAIVGPSGSGKSSLARAGLLASLKRGDIPGSDLWPAVICKPGEEPLESLAAALAGVAGLGNSPAGLLKFSRDLAAEPRLLHTTTRLALREAPDQRLVVLVDQFEEVFTLCLDEAKRQAFIANLLQAATAADGQTVVVLTLRADFYGRCAAYSDFAEAVSEGHALVGPMTREELRSAIQRPAYLVGCELEGGLTDLLLKEVQDQPGSLPLLEYALFEIWRRREGGRRLTIDAYDEVGGVDGALEQCAEKVFNAFTEDERAICQRIFLKLVQVGEQDRVWRRRLDLSELIPAGGVDAKAMETVVDHLIKSRLLTTSEEKHPKVELAHEALLTAWDRLRKWVEQDRKDLQIRHELEREVTAWLGSNRDPSCLYRGSRLALAEEWAERHPDYLRSIDKEFLAASIAQRDEEIRRLRRWVIVSATMAVVAVIAALAFFFSQKKAERKRLISVANDLVHQSVTVSQRDPARGLLLSIEAMRLAGQGHQPRLASTEESLRRALSPFRGRPLPTGKVRATAVSADGTWLAVAGSDGALSTWNLTENGPVEGPSFPRPRPPADPLGQLVAMGPGGRWLLAASKTQSSLFDLSTKNASITVDLGGEDWRKDSDPFSPDGRWLLTRQGRDSWILRDLGAPGRPQAAILRIDPSASIFSPDGRWLAVADPGTLKVWDLKAPSERPNLQRPGNENIETLAFSSDSQWLTATGGSPASRTVQAWRIDPAQGIGAPVRLENCAWNAPVAPPLTDPLLVSRIDDLANCRASDRNTGHFQPGPLHRLMLHGRWLIAQGGEEAPRVFEVLPGSSVDAVEPLVTAPMPGVAAVSSTGWRLSVDPADHQARLWGPHGPRPVTGAEKALPPWVFSPDGSWLAAAGAEGRPLAWRVQADGTVAAPVSFSVSFHHSSPVSVVVFSPDGRWLATGDQGGFARLWDLRAPNAEPRSLTNSKKGVFALAFSFDSHRIATAAGDGNVRLRKLNGTLAEVDLPERPTGLNGQPSALAFLPDGRLALGGARTRVELWDSKGPSVFLDNNLPRIFKLMASPKGDRLFSSTEDGTVQIWTLEGKELQPSPLHLPVKSGRHFAVTPDGNGLWGVDVAGKLYRWELRTENLLETACRTVGRNLTRREWRTYISSEPYGATEPCPELPKAFD